MLEDGELFDNKTNKKQPGNHKGFGLFALGGGLGIRTPGCFHIGGFQDHCFRPLSQTSIKFNAGNFINRMRLQLIVK